MIENGWMDGFDFIIYHYETIIFTSCSLCIFYIYTLYLSSASFVVTFEKHLYKSFLLILTLRHPGSVNNNFVCCALHCGRTMRTGMLWTETSLSWTCLSNDSASDHDGHTLEDCVIHLKWCVEAQIFSSIKLLSSEPIRHMDPTGLTLKPNKQSCHLSLVCSHAGLLLFVLGMSINIHSDHILRNLRKPGETVYRIPHGTAAPGPPQTTSWETPLHFLDQSSGASVTSHVILESSFFSQEECSALCLEQTSLGRLWSGAVTL